MWTKIVTYLINQGLLKGIADNIVKQGFSLLLLVAAVYWLNRENQLMRAEFKQELMETRAEIKQCQDQVLEYYRTDRKETDAVINKASDIMERLEHKLK